MRARSERFPLSLGRAALAAALAALLSASAVHAQPNGEGGGPNNPPAPMNEFSGVWNGAGSETKLYMAEDLDDLQTQAAAYVAEGLRLEAFESWDDPDFPVRHYAGVFRSGTGGRVVKAGLSSAAFAAERASQASFARRLIDVEVRYEGGGRVYAGLWATAFGVSELVVEDNAANFKTTWTALSATHHLVVMDTWVELGQLMVCGIFRTGAEPAGAILVVGDDDWASFYDEHVEDHARDWYRLIDIDTARGGMSYYSGRWILETPQLDWLAVFYPSWEILFDSDDLFVTGHQYSAYDIDPLGGVAPPSSEPMHLLDLEVSTYLGLGGNPTHGKPLHDGGTPGPPCRPTC